MEVHIGATWRQRLNRPRIRRRCSLFVTLLWTLVIITNIWF